MRKTKRKIMAWLATLALPAIACNDILEVFRAYSFDLTTYT
jgi:hypothetical protein